MGKQHSFQGLCRWFERRQMRSRLKRLGLVELEVELTWVRSGDGFRVDGLQQVGLATVRPVGNGGVLEVRMARDCPYGWLASHHGNLRLARRKVEGQAWYAACLAQAEAEERRRAEVGRRVRVEMVERELEPDCREVP